MSTILVLFAVPTLCTPTFVDCVVFVRNWTALRAGTPKKPEEKYTLYGNTA